MPLKFLTGKENVFQLLGDFQTPDPIACGVLKIYNLIHMHLKIYNLIHMHRRQTAELRVSK